MKKIFLMILSNLFILYAIAETVNIEKVFKDFEENAFDAREKYSSIFSIEGYVKNITTDINEKIYLSVGEEDIFSFETLSVYGIDKNKLIHLNKGDKIIVNGKLGVTEMLGMEFKESKIISKITMNQYSAKLSEKTKPFNISVIVKEYENNFLRSKIFFPGNIFVSGNSGNLSIDEDIFSDKKNYVLELHDKINEDSMIKIVFDSPTIVETISAGTPLIISGKLDKKNNLIEPKIENKFKINKIEVTKSSINNPLNIDEIIKQFNKNAPNAKKMYTGRVFISGKVDSVNEGTKYDKNFNEIKFSYLSLSGDGFMSSASINFDDTTVYDKLIKGKNIIISGKIDEFNGLSFSVLNSKYESGELSKGVEKIISTKETPLNVKDVVNLFESNSKQARIKYSGKLFLEGYINSISENYFTMKGTEGAMDLDLLYVNINEENILVNLNKMEKHIVSGKIGEGELLGLNLIDAHFESKINKNNLDNYQSNKSNPINAEQLVDNFENNPLRTRKIFNGLLFIEGFSDGVHEHLFSENVSFYLKLKGTTNTFDLDYVYVSFKDKNQYSQLSKDDKIIVKGVLGEVEFLGVALNEAILIK